MKIIWKETKSSFGHSCYRGWAGKICLFQYHWGYTLQEEKATPYNLLIFIGLTNKHLRLETVEECKKMANLWLKFIKKELK